MSQTIDYEAFKCDLQTLSWYIGLISGYAAAVVSTRTRPTAESPSDEKHVKFDEDEEDVPGEIVEAIAQIIAILRRRAFDVPHLDHVFSQMGSATFPNVHLSYKRSPGACPQIVLVVSKGERKIWEMGFDHPGLDLS